MELLISQLTKMSKSMMGNNRGSMGNNWGMDSMGNWGMDSMGNWGVDCMSHNWGSMWHHSWSYMWGKVSRVADNSSYTDCGMVTHIRGGGSSSKTKKSGNDESLKYVTSLVSKHFNITSLFCFTFIFVLSQFKINWSVMKRSWIYIVCQYWWTFQGVPTFGTYIFELCKLYKLSGLTCTYFWGYIWTWTKGQEWKGVLTLDLIMKVLNGILGFSYTISKLTFTKNL